MGVLLALDLATIEAAVRPALIAAAEEIAEDARRGAAMKELKSGPHAYTVEADEDGVRVLSRYWFAHLDEWGGSNVRSTPTGAARAAAVNHGRFRPE